MNDKHPTGLIQKSPLLILLIIGISVFAAEAFVMLLFHYLPQQDYVREAALDATLLIILVSPTLYFFLFRPMVIHIGARHKAEETLRKNEEEQFKLMLRASLDSFWITDIRGHFLEVNDAYCQLTGYSREELLGMDITGVEVMATPEETSRHLKKLLETGNDHFETRHRCKDGRILHVEASSNYSHAHGGRFYCFLRDITERKRVEDELKLSAQILNSISDSVFLLDPDGNFIFLNEAAWKTRGYTRDEMMNMNLRSLNAPAYNSLIAPRMHGLLENGYGCFKSAHLCKDGSVMPVEINARIIESGGRRLLLSVIRDITERERMENALQESEEKFRSMSAHTHDALIMMDDEGNISFWNSAAEKIFGYSVEEVLGKELHRFIAPIRYAEAFQKVFGHFRETGEGRMIGQTRELVALRKGDIEFPVELSLASLKLKNQWYGVGIVRDITERKRSEEMLRESESRLKEMFENLSSGVAVFASPDGVDFIIAAFNRAAERIDSLNREELVGKNAVDAFPGITEFGLLEVFRRVWKSGVAEHFPVSFYHDGRITGWRDHYVYKLPSGEVVAIYDDVTKEKQAEEQMHHLAHYDTLTGLPNRRLFNDRLQHYLAMAKRSKAHLALMFLDLDKFKPVNDTLGHDIGDLLLKEVAKRLLHCVRESDTVSRIGGDEFVVLLSAIEAEQNALAVAEKILYALNQPFELAGHSILISSSIGVAVYPEHGDQEKLLIKNADIAMYFAKNGGRNNARLYQPDMAQTEK